MGNGFGKVIAGLGSVMAGYAKGRAIYEDRQFESERRDRERQKWKDEDAIRRAMAGLADAPPRAPAAGSAPTISPIDGKPLDSPDAFASAPDDPNTKMPLPAASGSPEVMTGPLLQNAQPANPAGALAQNLAEQDRQFDRGQVVGEVAGEVQGVLDRRTAQAYLRHKAPKVIDAFLRTGNLEGAKRYRDFIDSEDGRNYLHAWARGARKMSIGDHQGALGDWERLYNDQLYGDGNTVRMTPEGDGKLVRIDQFDQSGKQIGTRTLPMTDLARQAGMALAPEQLVSFHAQQEAKRAAEAASLDKAINLEELRQQGRESAEDRRDARLQMRLDAQGRQFERRLEVQGQRGGLTPAQERGNAEIDAAREMVAGLSEEDIRQRTAPTTATGRENPNYSPQLATAAKLAGRRKIGDDEWFDQRQGRKPAAQSPGDDITQRFKTDPQMKGMRLGRATKDGQEVFDASGKLVGYYR